MQGFGIYQQVFLVCKTGKFETTFNDSVVFSCEIAPLSSDHLSIRQVGLQDCTYKYKLSFLLGLLCRLKKVVAKQA